YMGPAESKPLVPRIDGFVHEGTVRMLGRAVVPCNWLQIMENSLDPVHTEWLHGHTYEFVKEQKGQGTKVAISAHHEKIAFREFDHGITKHRLLTGQSEDCDDWKIGHPVVFPNILSVGAGDEKFNSRYYAFQIRVPMDDTHTLHLWYTSYVPPKGAKVPAHLLDKVYTYEVPYQDKNGDFILDNVDAQDITAWITQGAIADRTQEHLGASDNGIALYRRVLRREIKKVEEGVDPMFTFRNPAKNVLIDLPNEADKHHNAEGARSWIMRIHAAHSPIAEDVCQMYESVEQRAPTPLRVVG
ncbi:MAG: RHO alpha subunit C-terminal catalytic domain-containing protein, partial [Terriglobia bacterium]